MIVANRKEQSAMPLVAQAQLVSVLAEVVQIATGLIGAYLAVATVTTFAQAQMAATAGRPAAVAEMLNQFIPVLACAAVAVSAWRLGQEVAGLFPAGLPVDAAGALRLWQALADFAARAIVLAAGVSLAAALAGNTVATQVALALGLPRALMNGWHRIAMIMLTGVLTLLGLKIVNVIIATLVH